MQCYALYSPRLPDNSLTEITGLEKCCSLTVLNLEHNQIFRISGLSSLPLTHLSLVGPTRTVTHKGGLKVARQWCFIWFIYCKSAIQGA